MRGSSFDFCKVKQAELNFAVGIIDNGRLSASGVFGAVVMWDDGVCEV
jgi:hypothetical protein